MEEEVRVKSGEGVGRSKAPRKNTAMHFRMSPTGWCHTYCLALMVGALQVVTEIRACLMLHPQARGQPCCPSQQAPPTLGPCSRLLPSAFQLLASSSLLKDQPSWVGRWALDYSGLPPPPGEHLKSIDAPVFHRTRRCWLCMGVRSLALNLALSLVTSFPPHLTWEETEAQRGVVISPKARHLLSGTVGARTQICPVPKPAFAPLHRLCSAS